MNDNMNADVVQDSQVTAENFVENTTFRRRTTQEFIDATDFNPKPQDDSDDDLFVRRKSKIVKTSTTDTPILKRGHSKPMLRRLVHVHHELFYTKFKSLGQMASITVNGVCLNLYFTVIRLYVFQRSLIRALSANSEQFLLIGALCYPYSGILDAKEITCMEESAVPMILDLYEVFFEHGT